MSEQDWTALSQLSRGFSERVEPEVVDAEAGHYLTERFAYRMSELNRAVESANGQVHEYLVSFEAAHELITVVAGSMETLIIKGHLPMTGLRMDIGPGQDLRRAELATFGDDPFHSGGGVLFVRGPDIHRASFTQPATTIVGQGLTNQIARRWWSRAGSFASKSRYPMKKAMAKRTQATRELLRTQEALRRRGGAGEPVAQLVKKPAQPSGAEVPLALIASPHRDEVQSGTEPHPKACHEPLSDLILPRACPKGDFALYCLYDKVTKNPANAGLSWIAGAGFEPATFGL